MFYNKVNNPKIKIYRVMLNCFLIIAYLSSFNSCTTTGMYIVSPDSLEAGANADIKIIELKDGTSIDCEGKLIWKVREPDSSVVFVIASNSNIKTQDSSGQSATIRSDTRIPEKDVKKITMEITKGNTVLTAAAIGVGILFVVMLIVGAGTKSIKVPSIPIRM